MSLNKEWPLEIEENLKKSLSKICTNPEFLKVLNYAVIPAGKLFRPMLTYCMANDLGGVNHAHSKLACSLEMQHAYTLIHDDLPAMDDDDIRRGRPATHKKFTEWQAILAGDALLAHSIGMLAQIPHENILKLITFYTDCIGAEGLILGQVFDLAQKNSNISDILKIHELKTARLIQLALSGANILAEEPIQHSDTQELGRLLGINFQLLDDLCELTEDFGKHEREVNPFLNHDKNELVSIITSNTLFMRSILDSNKLVTTKEYINLYLEKIQSILNKGKHVLNSHVEFSQEEIDGLKL
jgi:geranylgeranyl pyrophosphate synthase